MCVESVNDFIAKIGDTHKNVFMFIVLNIKTRNALFINYNKKLNKTSFKCFTVPSKLFVDVIEHIYKWNSVNYFKNSARLGG